MTMESQHVWWLLDVLAERGYDLHALAHQRDPLPPGEYDRRYNGWPDTRCTSISTFGDRCQLPASHPDLLHRASTPIQDGAAHTFWGVL